MTTLHSIVGRSKRLPPVAAAFKDFLLRDGAPLIEQLVEFRFGAAPAETGGHAAPAGAAVPARVARRKAARPQG